MVWLRKCCNSVSIQRVCWTAKCSRYVPCPDSAGADKIYIVALNWRKRDAS